MGGIPNNGYIITERREKVFIMLSQGLTEVEIAKELNVGQSTICRDINAIKKQSYKSIEAILRDRLPYEYEKGMVSIEQLIKECWRIFYDETGQYTNKNKIDTLKLLQSAIQTRMGMLVEGPVTLKAKQIEQKLREVLEEDEKPQRNFMNLGLPVLKKGFDDDLR